MSDIFNSVVLSTVFASVVGAIVYLLKSTIFKKLPAKYQYMMWFVMIIKLIFPKGPQSKISVFNKIDIGKAVRTEEFVKLVENTEPIAKAVKSSADIIPCIWLTGFFVLALWTCISYFILKHKIRASACAPSEKTMGIFDSCKKITNTSKDIKITVQSHITTASLCGILRPNILITSDFENEEESLIEHTFIHELSHFKRKDIAVNYLLIFMRCVHWFNPILWFLFKKIRNDAELAADEKAMLYINPSQQKDYGLALINTASAKRKAPAILGIADNKGNIKKRIRAIANFKKPKIIQHICGIMTILSVACVCLTSAVIAKPLSNMIYLNLPKIDFSTDDPAVSAPVSDKIPPEEMPVAEEYVPSEVEQRQEPETYTEEKPYVTAEYTPTLCYNSDSNQSQSLIYKTDDTGEISFMVRSKSIYNHEVAINVCNVKTPGKGWDFRLQTNSVNYLVPETFEPNEEYIITVNAYCPGYYGIEGEVYIY